MSTKIKGPSLITEEFLQTAGPLVLWIGGGLIICLLIGLTFALSKKLRSPNATKTSFFSNALTTAPGMLLALLVGIIVAVFLGVTLAFIYRYFGVDDAFGQGSGSLIQAIWGSAATISASVVAIMLALEAIKQAKVTNRIEERVAKLQEFNSPVFLQLESIDSVKRDIDWYALSMYPMLEGSQGKVNPENAQLFLFGTQKLIDALESICLSPLFVALNQIPLKNLLNLENSEAVSIKVANTFLQTFGGLLNRNYLFAMQLRSKLQASSGDMFQIVKILNEEGRAFWSSLYTIRAALDYVGVAYIEDFMTYRIKPDGAVPDFNFNLRPPNACPEALAFLAKLAILMKPKSS
jgi:hypothetical protein